MADDEHLSTQARSLARQLAASDPSVLDAMKALLHQETIGDIAAALYREAQAHDKLRGDATIAVLTTSPKPPSQSLPRHPLAVRGKVLT